ncbi:VOC family protein [Chitinophagaceae bacterium MMS25-I14]
MQVPAHAINWFEIPVNDFDRAKNFYEAIFGYEMPERQMGNTRMGFLLYDFQNDGRGGAIVYDPEFYKPSADGSLIYLNCDPDLQVMLDKVEPAGGKILRGKIIVAPDANLGYWALIQDTEGNRIAFHSMG